MEFERVAREPERVPDRRRRTAPIRRSSLVVGATDDPAEREADRVADDVLRSLHRAGERPAVALDGTRIRRREHSPDDVEIIHDRRGPATRITASTASSVVGSVLVQEGPDSAEVTDLEVDEAQRGRGLGRRLVASAAEVGGRLGHDDVTLTSDDDGSGHLDGWYREMGFREEGEVDGRMSFVASADRLVRRAASVTGDATVVRRMKRKGGTVADKQAKRRKVSNDDSDDEDGGGMDVVDPTPRPPSARAAALKEKREKAPPKDDIYFDADEFHDLVHKDPMKFGVLEDELDEYEAKLDALEAKVDETGRGGSGGMSGSARSDKGDDMLAEWLLTIRVDDAAALISRLRIALEPIRHTFVDRDDAVVSTRTPSQQQAMSYLPSAALDELAAVSRLLGGSGGTTPTRKDLDSLVSANRVLASPKDDGGMDRGGFEILHMSGRAVGNPVLALPDDALDELIGGESMDDWTGRTTKSGESFTGAQHPGNLAIGSFAANTLMMALEGNVASANKDFVLETRAYAPRGTKHLASHIVMSIEHKPSGRVRWYYIPGTATIAPLEVYEHMEADARQFMQDAGASGVEDEQQSTYEYPTARQLAEQRDKAVAAAIKSGKAGGSPSAAASTSGGSAALAGPAATIVASGTTLYLNQTAGAGNCFFHSLYEAQTTMRSAPSYQQVQRQAVLDALQQRPRVTNSHFGGTGTDAFNRFATTILLEGRWVANQTPGIVADALDMRIVIHRPDGTVYVDFVPNTRLGCVTNGTVHLYYDGGHYNSYTALPL